MRHPGTRLLPVQVRQTEEIRRKLIRLNDSDELGGGSWELVRLVGLNLVEYEGMGGLGIVAGVGQGWSIETACSEDGGVDRVHGFFVLVEIYFDNIEQ